MEGEGEEAEKRGKLKCHCWALIWTHLGMGGSLRVGTSFRRQIWRQKCHRRHRTSGAAESFPSCPVIIHHRSQQRMGEEAGPGEWRGGPVGGRSDEAIIPLPRKGFTAVEGGELLGW